MSGVPRIVEIGHARLLLQFTASGPRRQSHSHFSSLSRQLLPLIHIGPSPRKLQNMSDANHPLSISAVGTVSTNVDLAKPTLAGTRSLIHLSPDL